MADVLSPPNSNRVVQSFLKGWVIWLMGIEEWESSGTSSIKSDLMYNNYYRFTILLYKLEVR